MGGATTPMTDFQLFNLTEIEKKKNQVGPHLRKLKRFRLNREYFWIVTLNKVESNGMNVAASKPKKKTKQIPLIIPPFQNLLK